MIEGKIPVLHTRKFRVAEVFGPTIQGEGRNVGMPCHFVRFGGCDYRCSWCDTPHAVLPSNVALLPKMDAWEILQRLLDVDVSESACIRWVVLTGGNPALLELDYLIELLHKRSYRVMVETQGTTFRKWFADVDDLCFSPKPPSSGMEWDFGVFQRILDGLAHAQLVYAMEPRDPYLKVPVFTDEDLEFALKVHQTWPSLELFISIGNDDPSLPTVGNPTPDTSIHYPITTDVVLNNFKEVLEKVLNSYPGLQDCRIFPQQHTLLWGNARGH